MRDISLDHDYKIFIKAPWLDFWLTHWNIIRADAILAFEMEKMKKIDLVCWTHLISSRMSGEQHMWTKHEDTPKSIRQTATKQSRRALKLHSQIHWQLMMPMWRQPLNSEPNQFQINYVCVCVLSVHWNKLSPSICHVWHTNRAFLLFTRIFYASCSEIDMCRSMECESSQEKPEANQITFGTYRFQWAHKISWKPCAY